MNSKADEYEYCVREFLKGLCEIAGIEDTPTFTRSVIVNTQEQLQMLIQGAQFLDQEYVTRKMLELFGDGDKADDMLEKMAADEIERQNQALQTMAAEQQIQSGGGVPEAVVAE